MIHVCFGLYDKTGRYSKFTGTAMLSMFDNHTPPTPSITVHILHDNTLTADNRDKFSYIAGQYGQLVKFYNVEELCADKIKKIIELIPAAKSAYSSIATFYRFFIPQLLKPNIDKVIYLDSDLVVNLDVKEFWQIELGDKILGVVPEIFNRNDVQKAFPLVSDGLISPENYFNAGVLLMNLEALRSEKDAIINAIKFTSQNSRYQKFMDQDILNCCFSTRTVKLPNKFNRFTIYARKDRELTLGKKIYHFAGSGLKLDMSDPFNRLWMNYFIRTPWFDVDTIGRLYAGMQQLHVGLKQSMANVSAMMSGKTRAFFVPPQSVDAIKKIFSVRADEEIILAENQTSLKKLIDSMNASRGRKLFFIILQGFPFQILNQLGFVAGRDFVNGMDFLSEAQGVSFNSHPLIKAM